MAANIRLVHGIDSLGVGGAQVMMFELYKAIERKYPEIKQNIFLLHRKSIDEPFVQSYGIKYDIVETFMVVKVLLDLANMGEPIVFVYHKLLGSRTEFYRKIYENLPVVVLNHSHSEGMMYNKIKECDAVIAVCQKMKQALKLYSPGLKYNVILNGIDGSPFEEIVPKSRTDSDSKCLVSGRINSFNRIKYSDQWVKWCCSVDLPVPLIHEYIGDGPYRKSAKKIIKSFKGQKNDIRLLGAVNEFKEKISIVKSWDIFLYEINRDEGVSIAILEALACGVPVICSNHHGNNEIIKDGVNGYIYTSHAELKEILTELALNRDILNDLSISTKKYFDEELDIKYRVDRYIDLFQKALQNPRPADKPKSMKSVGKNQKEALAQFSPKVIKKADDKSKTSKSSNVVKDIRKKIKLRARAVEEKIESLTMKFTILTAGHNNSKFIKDWAESIQNQQYRPLEVIYVNDCSSDNTIHKLVELGKVFSAMDIELKVVCNEKREGCGSAYHKGQKQVTGDFVGVLDSDDMLEPNACEYIVQKYMEYPDITWIYTQFDVYTNRWVKRGKGLSRPPREGLSMLDMGKLRKHTYSHWRTYSYRFPKPQKLFKKGLRAAVDKFMGYRLEEFGNGAWVDKVCYRYRQGSSSHCISNKEPTKRIWQQVVKEAYDRRKRYKLKAHPIAVLES